jgi:hypothetical protein
MERKLTFIENLNNAGFAIYLMTIGSVGYLIVKGVKKLLDLLAESVLQKYISSIRKEVEVYFKPLNIKLKTLEEDLQRVKNHENQNSEDQKLLLQRLFDRIEKKLDEKDTK